jgi:hypothetical protein
MAQQKPGPGSTKKTDGSYAVDEIVYKNFSGARTVAGVFHVLAWIVIIGGVVAALTAYRQLHGNGSSNSDVAVVVGSILGGTIFTAAVLAFFGYVLELLVAIHFDVRMPEAWDIAKAREVAASKTRLATNAVPLQIGDAADELVESRGQTVRSDVSTGPRSGDGLTD